MSETVGAKLKQMLPKQVRHALRHTQSILAHPAEARQQMARWWTKRVFEGAPSSPSFLPYGELVQLQKQYPFAAEYGYEEEVTAQRGRQRADAILSLMGAAGAKTFLELGCWDGMVSGSLAERGKVATGIDFSEKGFDARAIASGARLLRMDASRLNFGDESFEFIFSYNAFEHFADPDAVLGEVIRVTRPGGYVYLDFGPLYMSPFGEHAYRSITVPYCQFLFSRETINEFTEKNGLRPVDFTQCNGWPIERYREVWERYLAAVEVVKYREAEDLSHLDIIRRYPSCFRSKTVSFESLTVAHVVALFRKKAKEE